MPSYAVMIKPERSAASDSVKTAAIADPAESEIATLGKSGTGTDISDFSRP